jgi:cytochrome c oxidase cbb3-type subunit 2
VPGFFNASPEVQSLAAGLLCIAAIGVTFAPSPAIAEAQEFRPPSSLPFFLALACFTALVWLDSAAFFIIQNSPQLKSGTWQGTSHLSVNGALHLVAAIASAWLLQRKGLLPVLSWAFVALGAACLLLRNPDQVLLASVFYPVGVSLYSVALVAYPALLAPAASDAERGRIAGLLYAVAGWAGSAMGIGMGQHLGQVPITLVAAAGAVVMLPQVLNLLRVRKREVTLVAIVMVAAFFLDRLVPAVKVSATTRVERGRQVYISEGCIHCHSQYVRPNTSDVLMWGPVTTIADLRRQNPPLIGNRRQGPDLSQVGARRSALWLKAHLCDPAAVSYASIMPSYGFLFRDERGDDLVAYLESLHSGESAQQQSLKIQWQPAAEAFAQANAHDGEQLYIVHCATCHDAAGVTRRKWQSEFSRVPPDLASGPFRHFSLSDASTRRLIDIARITKFGIAGTDMPGHEVLSDGDIASISVWLQQNIRQSNRNP